MSRGALYIVWPGDPRTQRMLNRSIASLQKHHPELPYEVAWLPEGSTLLDKAAMADLTPFDETLFLDADTVVMGRLDHAFEKSVQHGLACVICECPWARRYPSCPADMIEYNAGILWFTKKAKHVFDEWKNLAAEIDSSIVFHHGEELRRMPLNDQASFASAVYRLSFNPYALPLNYNFRPIWHRTWFGPIKIYHDYSEPPKGLAEFSEQQSAPGSIIQYAKRGDV